MAHRYWRVYVTANTGSTAHLSINEIQLRESLGGADATGSGTASQSAFWFTGYEGSKAFDNNNSTHWYNSPPGMPQWVSYDFGAGNDKDIVELAIFPNANRPQNPSSFALQYSDDNSSWTTLFSVENYVEWVYSTLNVFSASDSPTQNGADTAWRVKVTARNGANACTVDSLMMFPTGSAVDACTGGKAFANTCGGLGANFPANAFDATAAYWLSEDSVTSWLGYRFASAQTITTVGIKCRTGADVNQAPKDFTVEYWNGSSWQVAMTLTNITGWTAGQTRYFDASGETTLSASSARPVVFVCT